MATDGLRLAADLVRPACADLRLSFPTTMRAAEIAAEADWHPNVHHGPTTTAAGAVYLAAALENEKVTQTAVGDVFDVNERSVSTAYQTLVDEVMDA
jgi:transcription initiation factor TFIIIB Brf1 subunit/transcription initiation factor TFIIB